MAPKQRTYLLKSINKKGPELKTEEEEIWLATCRFIPKATKSFNDSHIRFKFRVSIFQQIFKQSIKKYRKYLYRGGLYDNNVYQIITKKYNLIKSKIKKSHECVKKFIYSRSYGIGRIKDLTLKCRI